jgi:hypothetical protein
MKAIYLNRFYNLKIDGKIMKAIFCFLVVLQFNLIFSQEILTRIEGKKIDYFVNIEEKINSELFDSDQNYLSFDDSAQPIIYRRKEKDIPDLLVYYTFSKKDSIVNEILYEWDVYNFEKKDNNVKSEKFSKALIEKYVKTLEYLTRQYGKSKVEREDQDLNKIVSYDKLTREDNWRPNDSLEINMYITISNYYKKEGFSTVNPTHRIRVYVKNIKKNVEPELNKKIVALCEQNFETFLMKLNENNFVDAKLLMSDVIKEKVTDDQLISLKKMIDFDDKLIPYFKGFQFTMTGVNYLMIKYKYTNEKSEVPNLFVNAIFDEENKILGIQPMKMQQMQK